MLTQVVVKIKGYFLKFLSWSCNKYQTWKGLKFIGRENLPDTNNCIVISNHRHAMDPFLCGIGTKWLGAGYCWINKSETRSFFRRWLFSKYGLFKVIPVISNRANPELAKKTQAVLDSDNVVWLAPEGKRSREDVLLKGRIGVGWVFQQLKDPLIVPSVIYGEKTGGMIKEIFNPSPTTVAFGKPFRLSKELVLNAKPERKLWDELTTEIMLRLVELLPPQNHGAYADHDLTKIGKYTYTVEANR